ncbi:MAG: YIP1 family protein [Cellulosilyticaceae bacterium]
MELSRTTLKHEFLQRLEVYKLFFSKPREAMGYIGQNEQLDVYQMLFTLAFLFCGVLITGQGIFGIIGSLIGVTVSFFVIAVILFLLGLIGKAQMSYIKIVNLVMYTSVLTALATTFSLVTIVGGLIGWAASIYAFVLQIIGLVEIGGAIPKRLYIAAGVFVVIIVMLIIIGVVLAVTAFASFGILSELRYYLNFLNY